MGKKVSDLGKKRKQKLNNNHEQFKNKYPRFVRENSTLSPDFVSEDYCQYLPDFSLFPNDGTNKVIYAAAKEEPRDGLMFRVDDEDGDDGIDLEKFTAKYNSLLLYRMLKLMHGLPDIIGAFVDIKKGVFYPSLFRDWSYTLTINNSLLAEIRSKHNNQRIFLRFWTDANIDELEERKKFGEAMAAFFKSFFNCYEMSTHLFDETYELKEQKPTDQLLFFKNVFAGKYHSATKMLQLAESIDIRPEKQLMKWEEELSADILSVGSIYFASALLFITSLEALVNTIYEVLLKDEFISGLYKRTILKAAIEDRLLTMHLFCSGFTEQVLNKDKDKDLRSRFEQLRDFRNNTIHGNITDEHFMHIFQEDDMSFFYSPLVDFRGTEITKRNKSQLPKDTTQMNKTAVHHIKNIVDEIKDNILLRMDKDTREKVEKWLFENMVPAKRNQPLSKLIK